MDEHIRLLGVEDNVLPHPGAIDVFCTGFDEVCKRLDEPEGRMGFRNIIDGVVVHETAYRDDYDSMPAWPRSRGVELFPRTRPVEDVLESEGVNSAALMANGGGQVQRGNTWPQLHQQSVGVLFMAGDAS